jgi:hypothetical protein
MRLEREKIEATKIQKAIEDKKLKEKLAKLKKDREANLESSIKKKAEMEKQVNQELEKINRAWKKKMSRQKVPEKVLA